MGKFLSKTESFNRATIRFWAKVKKTDSCWNWIGKTDQLGYGRFYCCRKNMKVHRFSMVLHGYKLNPKLVIDHLCRNPSCVNPQHLEQVTQEVNARRGIVPQRNLNKTHCIHGHPFSGENLKIVTYENTKTFRCCIACKRSRFVELGITPRYWHSKLPKNYFVKRKEANG